MEALSGVLFSWHPGPQQDCCSWGWGMHAHTSAHIPTTHTTCLGSIELRGCLPGPADPPAELHQLPVCPGRWCLWLVRGCRALALREEDPDSPSVCSQRSPNCSQVEGLLPPSPQGRRSSLLHYPPHILNRINHLHDKQSIIPSSVGFLCCN